MEHAGSRRAAPFSHRTDTGTPGAPGGTGAEMAEAPIRCIDSRQLLGDQSEVGIAHDGTRYRLRVTALGKLILTK